MFLGRRCSRRCDGVGSGASCLPQSALNSVHLFGLGAERAVLFRRRWDGHGVSVRRVRAFFPPALLLAARPRRISRQEVEERRRRPVGLLVFGHASVPLASHAARRGAAATTPRGTAAATRSSRARCGRDLRQSRRQRLFCRSEPQSSAANRRAARRVAHRLPDDALEAARHAPRCEIAAARAPSAPAARSSHPRTHAPDPG